MKEILGKPQVSQWKSDGGRFKATEEMSRAPLCDVMERARQQFSSYKCSSPIPGDSFPFGFIQITSHSIIWHWRLDLTPWI